MPISDSSQTFPLPQQLLESREWLDLAEYAPTNASSWIQLDTFAEWSENSWNWWRRCQLPQLEDGAKREQVFPLFSALAWYPASHGSSGMWVWPPLTSQTQNVWRQPGARVLHQCGRNWVSTLRCSAKLPTDTVGPPWPIWGCLARCTP